MPKALRTPIGTAVFDSRLSVIDYGPEGEMEKKHKELLPLETSEIPQALLSLREKTDMKALYAGNMARTKEKIKGSIGPDTLIIQAINTIDDLTKVANMLVKRLREWYELYNPEFSQGISNHEKFVELILEKTKEELLAEAMVSQTMGADLSLSDLAPIMSLAREIQTLYRLREEHERYIESTLGKIAPNVAAVAGPLIGARLIELAGSLERMMLIPASTIQLLGAEKALFRHIVTGARCPKFGVIFNHPLVVRAKNKGKAARLLADKISIAVRVDYFKGEFIGDRLRKELEEKVE